MTLLPLLLLLAAPAAPARPGSAPPAKAAKEAKEATRAVNCRPTSAQRCSGEGCEAANEGLHAELFDLDAAAGTVSACLYTDCYAGSARIARDPDRPWQVTGSGQVRSSRPAGSVPPPGSAPFPLTVSVDLRTGKFTAIWSLSPEGLQVDFGRCELGGAR